MLDKPKSAQSYSSGRHLERFVEHRRWEFHRGSSHLSNEIRPSPESKNCLLSCGLKVIVRSNELFVMYDNPLAEVVNL